MRNRVIHGYDKIDDAIVWGAVVKYLPILQEEIDRLMKQDSGQLQANYDDLKRKMAGQ